MSDNGSAYISKAFAKPCSALGLKYIRTKPYTPPTNGKAEQLIQTLCREWAYSMPFQNSEECNRWRPRYLTIYNRLKKHSDIGHPITSEAAQ
jgi:transposase InsO family protein